MQDESIITIRHASLLTMQRAAYVAGSFAFAVIIPRLFGPALYGRFALIASVSAWFAMLGTMGLGTVVGRFVPLFVRANDSAGLRAFFAKLLAARFSGSLAGAACFIALSLVFFPDLGRPTLMLAAAVLWLGAVSELVYSFFWGLNRAAWWGMGELIRRGAQIVFLVPGFLWRGLPGAFLGLLGVELLVLGSGLWRVRSFLPGLKPWPDFRYLAPYIRFGLLFSLNDILFTVFLRSGEVLVRTYTSDYAQVGQFALAYAMYMTLAPAVGQLVLAFLPTWTSLQAQQRSGELRRWMERMMAWLAAGGMIAVFGLLLLGDRLIPLILGASFRPVTAHLLPLLLILPLLPVTGAAFTIALMQNRPGIALQTTAGLLISYLVLARYAILRWGSVGACWALLGSMIIYAAHFAWRVRPAIPVPLGRWAGTAAAAGPFMLLIGFLPAVRGAVAFLACAAGYCGVLFLARLIAPADASVIWRALRRPHATPELPLSRPEPPPYSKEGA